MNTEVLTTYPGSCTRPREHMAIHTNVFRTRPGAVHRTQLLKGTIAQKIIETHSKPMIGSSHVLPLRSTFTACLLGRQTRGIPPNACAVDFILV